MDEIESYIENYIDSKRNQIDEFVERHFSAKETIEIQKKTILFDLLLNPLNALWSIPYLTVKKAVETLDKIGIVKFTFLLEILPSGFKTHYQKEIEKIILNEWLTYPELNKHLDSDVLRTRIRAEFEREIDKYSAGQAMLTDMTSSLLTLFVGWLYLGEKSQGILGLGKGIASKLALEESASEFFLGKDLGTTFYSLFPPQPTDTQIFFSTLIVGVLLTLISLVVSMMMDPLRKKLGLHKYKLNSLLTTIEERLYIQLRQVIKTSRRKV